MEHPASNENKSFHCSNPVAEKTCAVSSDENNIMEVFLKSVVIAVHDP